MAGGISGQKENPQTAILSHLWECGVVTRTGIELTEQVFAISGKMRKAPKTAVSKLSHFK